MIISTSITKQLRGLRLFVLLVAAIWFSAPAAQDGAGNVASGARTWSDNCARCHNMRDPTEFRDDIWRPIIGHMRVRAGLTGQQARDVLAFMQASNVKVVARDDVVQHELAQSTAAGADPDRAYNQTCVACHSANGKGAVPGAPDFTAPGSPLSKADDLLLRHMIEGFQSPGSPMAMPARGGNPALTDTDLAALLAYLRERFASR